MKAKMIGMPAKKNRNNFRMNRTQYQPKKREQNDHADDSMRGLLKLMEKKNAVKTGGTQ